LANGHDILVTGRCKGAFWKRCAAPGAPTVRKSDGQVVRHPGSVPVTNEVKHGFDIGKGVWQHIPRRTSVKSP